MRQDHQRGAAEGEPAGTVTGLPGSKASSNCLSLSADVK